MVTPGKRIEPKDGQLLLKWGEYGKHNDGIWYVRPPGCHMGSLERHEVTEHEDGTITASPSILISGPPDPDWHGYLERGVFRTV